MTNFTENMNTNRIIQESVPGKEVTLIHLIANLEPSISELLCHKDQDETAIGIVTISPGEAAIIVADLAAKSGSIVVEQLNFDCGSVVIKGDLSSVEYALNHVRNTLTKMMHFAVCPITRT
ncbi:BMC domain-containing protein [Shewanella sp. D64]|uniref:BMC domain-containing protein n=1 Tax=unclassified Shewanella TaxID=196818 RepID=UPI0022BA713E|nr:MULTISPECIES: BMC domain-containing protein [unclassified Shewanella]MEC4725573.1 BMC domain-containing protein [Shewanella sp. D64]MEC4739625.1 BMC domain-containing protein [Shewanella sp. E94]WBJ94908.1 BMC domain-containing protein [Shewanella sp. MTB7]